MVGAMASRISCTALASASANLLIHWRDLGTELVLESVELVRSGNQIATVEGSCGRI